MADIGYRIAEPISEYISGEIDKSEFKTRVRDIEHRTEGANWWSISLATLKELQLTDEKDKIAVIAVLMEMYPEEDLERVFGTDLMDKADSEFDLSN
jgi:hypothetical protein